MTFVGQQLPDQSHRVDLILFNGAYGFDNLSVQSTRHDTIIDTPNGDWYATFLARQRSVALHNVAEKLS
jgi:hypothetical protein